MRNATFKQRIPNSIVHFNPSLKTETVIFQCEPDQGPSRHQIIRTKENIDLVYFKSKPCLLKYIYIYRKEKFKIKIVLKKVNQKRLNNKINSNQMKSNRIE